jgi:hypothetical protein
MLSASTELSEGTPGGHMPNQLELTAYHEAAHAVADERFCFPVWHVSIEKKGDNLGSEQNLNGWDTADGAKRYAISCYVGYAANVRLDPGNESHHRMRASDDFEKAEEALSYLGESCETAIAWASEFVMQEWETIALVATELLLHKVLNGDEIVILIAIADGDEGARESLADYRRMKCESENAGRL